MRVPSPRVGHGSRTRYPTGGQAQAAPHNSGSRPPRGRSTDLGPGEVGRARPPRTAAACAVAEETATPPQPIPALSRRCSASPPPGAPSLPAMVAARRPPARLRGGGVWRARPGLALPGSLPEPRLGNLIISDSSACSCVSCARAPVWYTGPASQADHAYEPRSSPSCFASLGVFIPTRLLL